MIESIKARYFIKRVSIYLTYCRPHPYKGPYLDNPTLELLVMRRPDLVISKLSLRHPDTETGYTGHNADTSVTPM